MARSPSKGKTPDSTRADIALVANSCWYIYNFRKSLILTAKEEGFNVVIIAPDDEFRKELEDLELDFCEWKVNRSSINPLSELDAILRLWSIYKAKKIDLVHHFTIKACLYGTIAAKGAKIYRVINSVTGLGHVFVSSRRRSMFLREMLKPVYRLIFSARRSTVVFQNADDMEHLAGLGITDSNRSRLIRGSGVDVTYFKRRKGYAASEDGWTRVLFPSRLINEKGTAELLSAVRSLWNRNKKIKLIVAGEIDSGNRSSLGAKEKEALDREKHVEVLGHVDDMRSLYERVDIVVLPSWREGLSRSLIEAAAMECAIITTDVPGCRDVVDHGVSGLLVPLKCERSIALAIELLMENNELAVDFGKRAREKVSIQFEAEKINRETIVQYNRLLNHQDALVWQPIR